MIDKARVRESLTGPISSIRPPFKRDGSLDFDGLRDVIDFNIAGGSKTMLLTAGDSHLIALTESEIAELTRVTVEHTAGRAMVVAADRYYHTKQSVDFADYCKEIGVDILMVLPPDWGQSCTPETLTDHFCEVAEHIPVMLVTGMFSIRGDQFGLDTMKLVMDRSDNVVAVKDDVCGVFARKMAPLVHDKWAVFAGGQKQNHLNMHPYGCDGYLSTFVTFKPDVSASYWAAIEANDMAAAANVIVDFDRPFFDLICGMTGGFDAGIHGTLELFGICGRWRRPPYYSLTDEDMAKLKAGLVQIGIME